MSTPRRRHVPALIGAAFLVLVLAGAGFAALRAPSRIGADPTDDVLLSSRTGAFRISGRVAGLYPGAHRRMRLKVHNLSGAAIRVVSIKVTTRNPSPQCSGRSVRVGPFRGRLVVPARASKKVKLPVVMRKKVASACQGSSFPLVFQGRAVRA